MEDFRQKRAEKTESKFPVIPEDINIDITTASKEKKRGHCRYFNRALHSFY